jgi:hypothetical protein
MSPRALPASLTALAVLVLSSVAIAAPHGAPHVPVSGRPARIGIIDNSQRLDINDIGMFVTNTGSFAWNKTTANAGLEFPKGTGRTAVYAAGLWLGAVVGGQTRLAVSEYSDEYGPGPMSGGVATPPYLSQYKVYKLNRLYGTTTERDAALADYNAGAVPDGAPVVTIRSDGSLTVPGDQMTWAVYNDADPANHTNEAGATVPLGVEVQQTTFAYAHPGPLSRTVFVRYQILNKGSNTLQNLYVGLWMDPDVGGATDDLTGCTPSAGLGYAYNQYDFDLLYGAAAPAVGVDLLSGPLDPGSGQRLAASSFEHYVNGTDPNAAFKTYNALLGLDPTGGPIVDPTTGLVTTFMNSGDPVAGTGWLDEVASDKRMLLSAGPITLSPGQGTDVVYAIVIGLGADQLGSVARMRCDDTEIQSFFDRHYTPPDPATITCPDVVSCPRTAGYWDHQFAGGGEFAGAQLLDLAERADQRSRLFDWSSDPVAGMSAALGATPGLSPRDDAKREFAAFLANIAAGFPPVMPNTGKRIYLDLGAALSCPGLAASNIDSLAASGLPILYDASYLDLDPTHPQPFVGAGFFEIGTGADTANASFPSSLRASTMPDSFVGVELRFDHAHPQLAYRWLRLTSTAGFPYTFGPSEYLYGGFRVLPFSCWDSDHDVQLEMGFIENAIVDNSGTLLPPDQQPATFDSTWAPTTAPNGGNERLLVFKGAYDGVAHLPFATDGVPGGNTAPLLYDLWVRMIDATSVIDDGDAYRFTWGIPPGPAADALLQHLETQSLTDPAVIQAYGDLTNCLSNINAGVGIGATCDFTTPVLASLVAVETSPDRVRLVWYAASAMLARVERREANGPWVERGRVASDGNGLLTFVDSTVTAGRVYGYHLRVSDGGADRILGAASVQVPMSAVLALTGFVPNPARGTPSVAFSLAERAPATLAIYDIAGRRRVAIEVGAFGPGSHAIPLTGQTSLASGIYLLRLTQGSRQLVTKAMLLR